MADRLPCFKVYDVRGIVPSELNAGIARDIGRALADETGAEKAVVGFDVRLSSREITDALIVGLREAGVDTTDIGLCGTEMVYFATAQYGFGAGVMITASHNPPEYNGMKFVRQESRPISGDSGLWEVERRARERRFDRTGSGSLEQKDVYKDFADHLLNVVPPDSIKPLKVLANAGNGCAGLAVQSVQDRLPLRITPMQFEPDGSFPNGVPNPMLEESRRPTIERMQDSDFDFGVAWDADFDRCFFFDEDGNFIDGYYIVGLLAHDTLRQKPGATIVHDPRLIWNTTEIIAKMGGRAVASKTGHAFIKERMRAEDAEYGGEMSAHHYFKAHWFCDSGMIPFLQIARIVSQSGRTLGGLVGEMQKKYPCSGEINSEVPEPDAAVERVAQRFSNGRVDRTDGLSVEFDNWRFNLRPSNTEPVVRLNVESRGDQRLVQEKVEEILKVLRA
ncbi:MAG: phosphomannomutase [Armatimonadetes bacterium]|nr:phosphomannomutase [Armatimonadota bacterium]